MIWAESAGKNCRKLQLIIFLQCFVYWKLNFCIFVKRHFPWKLLLELRIKLLLWTGHRKVKLFLKMQRCGTERTSL